MKFESKYPTASATERFEFQYSYVTKTPKLGRCRWCDAYTKWMDLLFQVNVCSEECNAAMWRQYQDDPANRSKYQNFEGHFERVKEELVVAEATSKTVWKDILVVVHDQLDYLKVCIDSIFETTHNFHLYLYDNGSRQETQHYIASLIYSRMPESRVACAISTIRSETNDGFIRPNNDLAELGESPYIILLNSDTKVFENWDRAMIGHLENNPDVAQVGFWGGHLGPDGRGFGGAHGYDIDYVPGWCFCISRDTYKRHGLFDKDNLQFAYCEDADLSLRLKEAGKKIYALHAPLCHHFQNKTIVAVEQEDEIDVRASFDHNHRYIQRRWKDYLQKDRVLVARNDAANEPRKESHGDDHSGTRLV